MVGPSLTSRIGGRSRQRPWTGRSGGGIALEITTDDNPWTASPTGLTPAFTSAGHRARHDRHARQAGSARGHRGLAQYSESHPKPESPRDLPKHRCSDICRDRPASTLGVRLTGRVRGPASREHSCASGVLVQSVRRVLSLLPEPATAAAALTALIDTLRLEDRSGSPEFDGRRPRPAPVRRATLRQLQVT